MRCKSASIAAALALAVAAAAQPTTEMTYQGQLKDGGQPASGTYDLRFRLFDAAQGGNQLGEMLCLNDQAVVDGLFTVPLDFGQQFASSDQRFLDIQVRQDTGLGCGNGNGFVSLKPRQLLTVAPTASHANSAFALDAADGGPTNALLVDHNGFVGIGTPTPAFPLSIQAKGQSALDLQDTSPGDQQTGYVSLRDFNNHETGWMGFGFPGSPDLMIDNLRGSGITSLLAGNQRGLTLNPAGEVRLGHAGDVLASGGVENLRIIRGTVFPDGTILAGKGFSCQHVNTGDYLITFDTPFPSPPSIIAIADEDEVVGRFYMSMVDNVSASDARVYIVWLNISQYANRSFHFIAAGPR